jgi:hypothetical protein
MLLQQFDVSRSIDPTCAFFLFDFGHLLLLESKRLISMYLWSDEEAAPYKH